jgi:hypothetical protein
MYAHPYRPIGDLPDDAPQTARDACLVCKIRSALTAARLKSLAILSLALLFSVVNVTAVIMAERASGEARRILAKAESLHDATVSTLSLWDARSKKPPPPPPPPQKPNLSTPSSANVTPASSEPSRIAQGILRLSATEYYVDRFVVRNAVEDGAAEIGDPRLVPETENGRVAGIRLFGIAPDKLFGMLGLQSGDRIQAIDGLPVTGPDVALEAYVRLGSASQITLKLERRGSIVQLRYHLV